MPYHRRQGHDGHSQRKNDIKSLLEIVDHPGVMAMSGVIRMTGRNRMWRRIVVAMIGSGVMGMWLLGHVL